MRPRGRVSLMVWGCICYEGVGTLTGVEGNINAAKYIEILEGTLWRFLTMLQFIGPVR